MQPHNPQEIAGMSTRRARTLVCPCGATFTTTRPHVKYCGPRCSRKIQRRREYLRRHLREQNGKHSLREWYEKCERFKNECFWCGASLINSRGYFSGCKDHLVPLAKGG